MNKLLRAPELLAPAGSLAMLRTALDFGADAVYAGQPRYSLRARNNEFGDLNALEEGLAEVRRRGARLYLVSNIYPHNAKVRTYLSDMAPVMELHPDALIMADPGLMAMVRERWPDMPIHLSVQSNTVNYAAVRFWRQMGVSRVILSRELSLNEIAEIRQECPDTELEVFVHGALCIAYSGRCLLSGYFNHRDANQGTCTNSCRWDYRMHETAPTPEGGVTLANPASRTWLMEEKQRAGEFMPVEEDEHGTYVLNSKDLRAIEHVRRLVEIGVDSLKIEGRTKSPYYVARVCQTYRQSMGDALAGRPLDPRLLEELEGLSNRGYTEGFFRRNRDGVAAEDAVLQNYERGSSESSRSLYVGDVVAWREGLAEVVVKNRFSVGDRLEVIHPSGNREIVLEALFNLEGQPVSVASGSGHRVRFPLPEGCTGAFLARFL
ncbi:MAG: tRNA 5-hydroxyuridine modification protein YegQ [Rhodocyclaceae bacterium]|nr:tRNA 5-hydroxyuridine modification protein YegQ [Rhodocyclaceae bacterium]